MKINPLAISLTGGVLGSSLLYDEDSSVLNNVVAMSLGSAIGVSTFKNLSFILPKDTFTEIKSEVEIDPYVKSSIKPKEEYVEEISKTLKHEISKKHQEMYPVFEPVKEQVTGIGDIKQQLKNFTEVNLGLNIGAFNPLVVPETNGVDNLQRAIIGSKTRLANSINPEAIDTDIPFNPLQPKESITQNNLHEALRYYEGVSKQDIKQALNGLKVGEAGSVNLAAIDARNIAEHEVRTVLPDTLNTQQRADLLYSHLQTLEERSIHPEVLGQNKASIELARTRTVSELMPFLDRMSGHMTLTDGVLTGYVEDEKFSLPLTRTLHDGTTRGIIRNDNVYVSKKMNIVGSLLAQDKFQTLDAVKNLATDLGLDHASLEFESLRTMLLDKQGISKEAVLGLLSSVKGSENFTAEIPQLVSRLADETSEKIMLDRDATSQFLKLKSDRLNGVEKSPLSYSMSEYTKHQASLIDASLTLDIDNTHLPNDPNTNINVVKEQKVAGRTSLLRKVKVTTDERNPTRSEANLVRLAFTRNGEDRVSGVKADKNLVFTPSSPKEGERPSLFLPYNRNATTVMNREMTVESTPAYDLDGFKAVHGGQQMLGSAVKLPVLLTSDNIADHLGHYFGGDTTIADGSSIGNRSVLNNFEYTTVFKKHIKADTNLNLLVKNPELAKVLNNQLSFNTLKQRANIAENDKTFFYSKKATKILEGNIARVKERLNLAADLHTTTFESSSDMLAVVKSNITPKDFTRLEEKINNLRVRKEKEFLIKSKKANKQLTERQARQVEASLMDEIRSHILQTAHKNIAETGTASSATNEMLRKNVNSMVDNFETIISTYKPLYQQAQTLEDVQIIHTDLRAALKSSIAGSHKVLIEDPIRQIIAKKEAIQNSHRAIFMRPDSVIGYGADNQPVKIGKDFPINRLININYKKDLNGDFITEFIYRGTGKIGDQQVVKTFSPNIKQQVRVLDNDEFLPRLVYTHLANKGLLEPSKTEIKLKGDDGKFYTIAPDKISQETFHEDIGKLGDNFSEVKRQTKLISRRGNKIGLITSRSEAGYKYNDAIDHVLNTGESHNSLSKPINELLQSYHIQARTSGQPISDAVRLGLKDFTYALSTDKPALSSLVTSHDRAKTFVQTLPWRGSKERIVKGTFLHNIATAYNLPTRNKTVRTLAPLLFDAIKQDQHYIHDMMSTSTGVHQLTTDPTALKNLAGAFVRNAHLSTTLNPDLISAPVAFNVNAHVETGAGSRDKKISANAQIQLKANGYTGSELNLYGHFDKGAHDDLHALTGMNKKHELLLNKHIEQLSDSQLSNIFGAAPEQRKEMLSRLIGEHIPHDTEFYNLHYQPKTGIQSVPLMMGDSRNFASFLSSGADGQEVNSRVHNIISQIVQKDLKLSQETNPKVIQTLTDQLDVLHQSLERQITPILSGSNSLPKAALTRIGTASTQSIISASNGEFSDFIVKQQEAVKNQVADAHASYAALSEEGLFHRLGRSGLDISPDDKKAFATGDYDNVSFLRKADDFNNLYHIQIPETNIPMHSMLIREPSMGPMSARYTEYMLDTSIQGRQTAGHIYISSKDTHATFGQISDYDLDTVSEHMLHRDNVANTADVNSVVRKGRELSRQFESVIDFTKQLGVKQNKVAKLNSLFDSLDVGSVSGNLGQWQEQFIDYVYNETTKSGLRKSISPAVTILASQLNNSVMQHVETGSNEAFSARILNHYLVENLIKAQHSTGDATGETDAERLTRLRTKAIKTNNHDDYLTELRTTLHNQLANISSSDPSRQVGLTAVDNIVNAEKLHMSGAQPINSMELGGHLTSAENLGAKLNIVDRVVKGVGQSVPVHDTIQVNAPSNAASNTASSALENAKQAVSNLDRKTFQEALVKSTKASKEFFVNNKKVLGLGAAGLAVTAIATRQTPEVNYEASADPSMAYSSEVGRQSLAPNSQENNGANSDPALGRDFRSYNEYITPHRDARQAVKVDGEYRSDKLKFRKNIQRSLFGNNIDSGQVKFNEDI